MSKPRCGRYSIAVRELLAREEALFVKRTPASRALFERASGVLAGGVASSFQALDPHPLYFTRGEGSRLWDVDGNEYLDFHNGFSAMVQGHAHPAITEAVARRARDGTHFGATTEDAVTVAEELRNRFRLDRWRFTNSGTESTMEAIRIARAATGRDAIVVAEGVYHGHHDGVLPPGPGVPAQTSDLTVRVPFNAAVEMENAMRETQPAAVLLEPLRTNAGLIPPAPGYLEEVRRSCTERGVILIFDEVKTGLTIAAGGATERFGVQPDMVALAKALGAGLPSGAVGMTAELGGRVASGAPPLMGTFNGNPLGMAAARASLEHVLTEAAYGRLEELGERMRAGVGEGVVAVGSKGCVQRGAPDAERSRLIWLWLANRGILTTARREQEWNVTVAHDEAAADAYIETFAELSRRWSGSAPA